MAESNGAARDQSVPTGPNPKINAIGWAIFLVIVAVGTWWQTNRPHASSQAPGSGSGNDVIACPICDGTGDTAHRSRASGGDRYLDPPWCPCCRGNKQVTQADYDRYCQSPAERRSDGDPPGGLSQEQIEAAWRPYRPPDVTADEWKKRMGGQ